MFNIENEDGISMFRKSSALCNKIEKACKRYGVTPNIRVYHKSKGDTRGVYCQGSITLLCSKPETPTSMFWVFLHELKHHIMEINPKLYTEYFIADEVLLDVMSQGRIGKLSTQNQMMIVHDIIPTEVLCNAFATEELQKDYGISWYQRRKQQLKTRKKNVKSNRSRHQSDSGLEDQNRRNR